MVENEMKSSAKIRPHQSALLIAGLLTLAGLLVPMLHRVLLPIQYLDTHLHELSHALVAQITGAQVDEIRVNADGSGVTPVRGGIMLLIASAGYLGASVFGAAMIYFGRAEQSARLTLITLAVLLAFSMLVWVRGDAIGEVSGFGWIAALVAAAAFLRGNALLLCCQFLGLQQCLSSVEAVFQLVKITAGMEVHSDASIMQDATGVPSVVWALTWCLISTALILSTLKRSWHPAKGKLTQ
jgi:hypothetical protein